MIMGKIRDLTGQRFGRLVVKEFREINRAAKAAMWLCVCDCGNEVVIRTGSLTDNVTKSCGCYFKEINSKRTWKHGHFVGGKQTPTYRSWGNMKQRCFNENAINYCDYGGRGITICSRWKNSFVNFLEDMGERPEGKTMDRIDNDGNYEPDNCRWATPKQQANNRIRGWKIYA